MIDASDRIGKRGSRHRRLDLNVDKSPLLLDLALAKSGSRQFMDTLFPNTSSSSSADASVNGHRFNFPGIVKHKPTDADAGEASSVEDVQDGEPVDSEENASPPDDYIPLRNAHSPKTFSRSPSFRSKKRMKDPFKYYVSPISSNKKLRLDRTGLNKGSNPSLLPLFRSSRSASKGSSQVGTSMPFCSPTSDRSTFHTANGPSCADDNLPFIQHLFRDADDHQDGNNNGNNNNGSWPSDGEVVADRDTRSLASGVIPKRPVKSGNADHSLRENKAGVNSFRDSAFKRKDGNTRLSTESVGAAREDLHGVGGIATKRVAKNFNLASRNGGSRRQNGSKDHFLQPLDNTPAEVCEETENAFTKRDGIGSGSLRSTVVNEHHKLETEEACGNAKRRNEARPAAKGSSSGSSSQVVNSDGATSSHSTDFCNSKGMRRRLNDRLSPVAFSDEEDNSDVDWKEKFGLGRLNNRGMCPRHSAKSSGSFNDCLTTESFGVMPKWVSPRDLERGRGSLRDHVQTSSSSSDKDDTDDEDSYLKRHLRGSRRDGNSGASREPDWPQRHHDKRGPKVKDVGRSRSGVNGNNIEEMELDTNSPVVRRRRRIFWLHSDSSSSESEDDPVPPFFHVRSPSIMKVSERRAARGIQSSKSDSETMQSMRGSRSPRPKSTEVLPVKAVKRCLKLNTRIPSTSKTKSDVLNRIRQMELETNPEENKVKFIGIDSPRMRLLGNRRSGNRDISDLQQPQSCSGTPASPSYGHLSRPCSAKEMRHLSSPSSPGALGKSVGCQISHHGTGCNGCKSDSSSLPRGRSRLSSPILQATGTSSGEHGQTFELLAQRDPRGLSSVLDIMIDDDGMNFSPGSLLGLRRRSGSRLARRPFLGRRVQPIEEEEDEHSFMEHSVGFEELPDSQQTTWAGSPYRSPVLGPRECSSSSSENTRRSTEQMDSNSLNSSSQSESSIPAREVDAAGGRSQSGFATPHHHEGLIDSLNLPLRSSLLGSSGCHTSRSLPSPGAIEAVRSVLQVEMDEAYARLLQEQLDNEVGSEVGSRDSAPSSANEEASNGGTTTILNEDWHQSPINHPMPPPRRYPRRGVLPPIVSTHFDDLDLLSVLETEPSVPSPRRTRTQVRRGRLGSPISRDGQRHTVADFDREAHDRDDGLPMTFHLDNDSFLVEVMDIFGPVMNQLHHVPGRSERSPGRNTRRTRRRGNMDPPIGYEDLLQLADNLGQVRQGLTAQQMSRLPTYSFQKEGQGAKAKSSSCQICMCDYENSEELRVLPCFHEFHCQCIDRWLRETNTCPVCRMIVAMA